jgi:hypothetical protein
MNARAESILARSAAENSANQTINVHGLAGNGKAWPDVNN